MQITSQIKANQIDQMQAQQMFVRLFVTELGPILDAVKVQCPDVQNPQLQQLQEYYGQMQMYYTDDTTSATPAAAEPEMIIEEDTEVVEMN